MLSLWAMAPMLVNGFATALLWKLSLMLRAKTRCEMRLTCIGLELSEPFEYDIRRFVTLKEIDYT